MQTISFTLCFQSEIAIELAGGLFSNKALFEKKKKSYAQLKDNLERPWWTLKM